MTYLLLLSYIIFSLILDIVPLRIVQNFNEEWPSIKSIQSQNCSPIFLPFHMSILSTIMEVFHTKSYFEFCIRIYDSILQVKNREEIGAWFLEPCNQKSKQEGHRQVIKGIPFFENTLFCIYLRINNAYMNKSCHNKSNT